MWQGQYANTFVSITDWTIFSILGIYVKFCYIDALLYYDGLELYFAEIDFKVATKFDFIQMHSEKAQFGDLKWHVILCTAQWFSKFIIVPEKRFMFELGDLFSIYFLYLLCGFLTALSVS